MTTPSIDIKRHFEELSEKEKDELAGTVADMLVTFIKNRKPEQPEVPAKEACGPETN